MADQKHYDQSPDMLHIEVHCTDKTPEQLKAMDIDRRWREDNRSVTWTFGMQNFAFDQNFIWKGMLINDTDDRVQKIVDKNLEDKDEVVGTRNIRYNGSHLKPEIKED